MHTVHTERTVSITSKVRRQGNSFVVTIPRADVERLSLREGQLVRFEPQPLELYPALSSRLREHAEALGEEYAPALKYLAGDE